MKIDTDFFILDGRPCKVYSSAGSVKYIIVQAVENNWIVGERLEKEIPAALGQAVDTRTPE